MKTNDAYLRLAFSLGAAFWLWARGAAGLPLHDPMNYPTNLTLAGLLNPDGNPWTPMGTNGSTGTQDIYVTNYALAYPGLETSATNSVVFGNLGYTERVAINPLLGGTPFALTSGTVYYSFVFSLIDLAQATSSGGFCCAFTTVTGSAATQPTVGGARLYVRLSAANPASGYNIGIGKSPGSPTQATWATNEFNVGDTNFIVASYTYLSGNSSNDLAQLWVNPAATNLGAVTPPPPDVTNTNGNDVQVGGANQIESFYFRQGNTAIPIIMATDLRLGFCWACVTPPTNAVDPAAPTLSIATASPSQVAISWPTNTPCFVLQSRTDLSSTNIWAPVAGEFDVTPEGDRFVTTNTMVPPGTNGSSKFFRLGVTSN